jgi:hypothetical protein
VPLTLRQLNRATLDRQLLLKRARTSVTDAVRRVIGLQAQEPATPYLALWNRVARFDPSDLDAAFADGTVVKASLMRITLHAVHREDYTAFHEAMLKNLRASRLHDRRFQSTGLTIADADALVPHLLELTSRPRGKAEIEAMLGERLGADPERGVWWALRTFAPLVHAPTGAAWSFGSSPAYRAAPTSPPRVDAERSLQRLFLRYLEGFGPASGADFGQFALQRQPAVRATVDALADRLTKLEGPEGTVLFDLPGAKLPKEGAPAPPRLLPMWDNVLLAHVDRGRVMPAEYRQVVMRRNGDALPAILVDGFVCGVWRAVDAGIEVTAFHPLTDEAWKGLATEARSLLALLAGREPAVYRRYAHWWSGLPSADIRVLGP